MIHDELERAIRAWADARALPDACVARWLALEPAARARLFELAERLKFRTGQFITAFTLLEEIGVREGVPIASILAREPVRRVIDAAGSGPGKARALIDALRVMRYPRLHQAAERLGAEVAALEMPRGIKVVLPRELASDDVRIELVARGGAEMRRLIEALGAKAAALARIAEMLGGADEI
ncbi:MAG TPA: hypothetical protein VJN94_08135 [Candidatus Binataceae bacterium]|nr:hypothetical protein [Candidatus Binataceae bacterium]